MKEINENKVEFIVVKGEIRTKEENQWVRPFLQYIADNPKYSDVKKICRVLFADDGKARLHAVQNILTYFAKAKLIDRNGLTDEGKAALASGQLWKNEKGCFLITKLNAADNDLLLSIESVPENWFKGTDGLHFDWENAITPGNFDAQIVSLEPMCSETRLDMRMEYGFSRDTKQLLVKVENDSRAKVKSYERIFKFADDATFYSIAFGGLDGTNWDIE